MKKIIMIIMILLMFGCTKEEKKELENKPVPQETTQEEPKNIEPVYVDTNPIKVGLYHKGKLVHQYKTSVHDKMDIATFNIVFTNEENLNSTNLKNNWNKYYQKYQDIADYKIGFLLEMEVDNQKMENLILDPSSQHKLHPYLYTYLYDGLHAKGNYTHLTMKDLKDNTVYTSIKLYLHQNTKKITFPIYLTVFTYKDENDFLDGHYRGNSFYKIEIIKK